MASAHLLDMTNHRGSRIAYSTGTNGISYRPGHLPARGLDVTKVVVTEHLKTQARSKGITGAQVREALENPYKVTEVQRYPGQRRYCGRPLADGRPGVAVVMEGNEAVTTYLDGVVTERRADQNDYAAMNSRRLASAR